MANFPTSLDNGTSLPNPTGTNTQNNPDHAALHSSENAAIIAAETKLGTGATVPAANQLLFGTGAGTSAWQALTSAQLAAVLSDETGTGSAVFSNTPVLITPKVDTINENTGGNGVTVGGVNLKSGVISTANAVGSTAIATGAVGNSQVAAGVVVQVVSSLASAVATGTTLFSFADIIPTNTQGDQYMSLAITPKASTNLLVIQSTCYFSFSVIAGVAIALFQDTTANALAATETVIPANGYRANAALTHTMTAGTTSATTFKIRIGGESAGTLTFNGSGGARNFGAIPKSAIVITEVKV